MRRLNPLAIACGVFAIVCLVVAIVYFTKTAADLPSFFPGHDSASTKHHLKHGVAMIGLAVVSSIGVWMLTGPKDGTTSR